jgi:hypothetical protein
VNNRMREIYTYWYEYLLPDYLGNRLRRFLYRRKCRKVRYQMMKDAHEAARRLVCEAVAIVKSTR